MALGEEIDKAEHKRQEAADRLAIGETRLGEADKAMRQAEAELASARESRVRREGLVEQATKDREARGRAHRRAPALRARRRAGAGRGPVAGRAARDREGRARLERLVHERETMGAVNLRAEEEANELEQQITGMTAERDDLVAAIGRLRQGIQSLNREGRERFLVAFEQVSGHFQQLFTKLFGGGKAELRLTESEDPLEAGLEIHASPPGKKLQVMSLLSGGEQALTALSLLFAVFMTNPAPICVLDEVDAPLDDLNVERFCAPGEGDRRPHRHALHGDHPPSRHHGAHGPPLRRDHGRAGRVPAGFGQPAGGRPAGGLSASGFIQATRLSSSQINWGVGLAGPAPFSLAGRGCSVASCPIPWLPPSPMWSN